MINTTTTDTPILRNTIINLRDLHGLTTKDNGKIKANKLFRSANPTWASDEDRIFLKSLNLSNIVDFRSQFEKRKMQEATFTQTFPVIAQPIDLGDLVSDQILSNIKMLKKEDVHHYMCNLNRLFVTDYQEQFKYFMKLVETGEPILFHCTAGKDRTGFATLLLLSALGVDDDTIMANYLESNLYTKAIFQDSDEHAQQLGMNLAVYQLFQIVTEDYLYSAKKVIDNEFNGVENYLRKTLKIDIETIQEYYLE